MNSAADMVLVADTNGTLYRYNTHNFNAPVLAETVKLMPDGVSLTGIRFPDRRTVDCARRAPTGRWTIYYKLPRDDAKTTDGVHACPRIKVLAPHKGAIVAMDASQRGKMFVTADDTGEVWLRHSTSEQVVLRLKPSGFLRPLSGGGDLAARKRRARGE